MSDAPAPGASYDGDEESEALVSESSVYRSRRAVRLALSLGAGLSRAGGESVGLAALGARAEVARGRALVGLDASLWFVDGLNAEGGLFATVGARLARRVELAAGPGLRFTGDALGPALEIVLRVTLPLRGFATYLRYDGALLRQDGLSTGQNAFSFGVEARW